MTATLTDFWLTVDEPIGLVLGLWIVWCLIRQDLWAWPLGIVYVVVLVTPLLEARLYANLALHVLAFLPMNLYGWYFWIYGKRRDEDAVPVTHAGPRLLMIVLGVCAGGTVLLGTLFAFATDAALPYWDNGIFVCSIVTMWLTARKKIENWIFWFVIDVVQVGVYWIQGLVFLAVLYFVYLAMAVAGWVAWKRSMQPPGGPPPAR